MIAKSYECFYKDGVLIIPVLRSSIERFKQQSSRSWISEVEFPRILRLVIKFDWLPAQSHFMVVIYSIIGLIKKHDADHSMIEFFKDDLGDV